MTGMSGGGKSNVLKMLEDFGFYCVDNLPASLIEKFVELISVPNGEITKVALGLDVRADQSFKNTTQILRKLKDQGLSFEILFMEASEQVLIKRYKETRRVHPLAADGRVEDGVRREREVLQDIRGMADYVIDTSQLLTRELKTELERIFVSNEEYNSLMVTIMSFGFKHGIPSDADLVFDVRFLPNPFYVEELRPLSGLDRPVAEYVFSYPQTRRFMEMIAEMLDFLLPHYMEEGKLNLTIAIGCTGGRHRSVAIAAALNDYFTAKGVSSINVNRDKDK